MPVTLQVTGGPAAGRKIYVARGQITRIGRTEWADVSFPDDTGLADIHFEIHATGPECLIRDTSGGNGTLLNDVKVVEARLHTGDLISAGQTIFSVTVEGEAAPDVPKKVSKGKPVAEKASPKITEETAPSKALDYSRPLKMGDQAKGLLTDEMQPAEYFHLLVENQLYPDAIRFLGFWLPRPLAIDWACDCVESIFSEKLTDLEKTALEAARTWSQEPSEANCRAAERAAIETEFSGAAGWLALGAFWSGDSLAPEGMAAIPPAPGLTAEAITGSLMLSATHGPPKEAMNKYRQFLELGQARLPKE